MKKLIIRIFNLAFIALTAVSMIMIFTKPIVDVKLSIPMPTDMIYDALHEESTTSRSVKRAETGSTEDIIDKITKDDLEECLGDISLTISISVPSPFKYDYNADKAINNLLKESINTTLNNNIEPITTGFKALIIKVAGIVASDAITQAIKDEIAKTALGEDAEAIFEQYGIGTDVEGLVDTVFEKMEEGVTPAQLAETISEEAQSIAQKLSEAGVEGFEGVTEFDTSAIEEQMTQMFEEAGLIDEETGMIMNIDQALEMLLDGIPTGNDSSDQTQTPPVEEKEDEKDAFIHIEELKKFNAEGDDESEEELNAKVKALIDDLMSELDVDSLDLSLGGYGQYAFLGLTGIMLFPWALFLLITIIRTIRKRKCWTKPWVVFFFAFLQLILGVGLTIAAAKVLPILGNALTTNAGEGSAGAAALIGSASLVVKTGVFVPSIIYLVMIPLTIVYMVFCHKVKKEFKQYKKDKKSAKHEEAPAA